MNRLWLSLPLLSLVSGLFATQGADLASAYYHFSLAKMNDSNLLYFAAIAEFEKALALDPGSSRLHYEFARTLLRAKEIQRAVEECQKSIQIDPENVDAHFLLGRVYESHAQNNQGAMLDKALSEFERVIEIDPDHQEALFNLGQLYFFRGDHEKAAATFAHVIEIRPDLSKAYNYRAKALIGIGEYHGAIEVLEEALKLPARSPENVELLGVVYERTRQFAKALTTYQQAQEMAPTLKRQYRIGVQLARLDRFDEAVSILREVVDKAPENLAYKVELGKALEGNRQYRQAADVFRDVLKLKPEEKEANYYLASSLRALGLGEEAIAQIEGFLAAAGPLDENSSPEVVRDLTRFQSFLALLYQEARRFDEAVRIFRRIVSRQPDNSRAKLGLIYALKDAGHVNEALRLSQELFEQDPDDVDVVITRARILSIVNRLDEAVDLLKKQTQGDFAKEDFYVAASQLCAEHKMYARAEKIVLEGLSVEPDSQRMQFQLGAMYERQGKVDDAERQFREILESNPRHGPVLNYLGYMLADRGQRLREALRYIEKAVTLDPYNGAYLDSLGWVYFKLNQLEKAEKNLVQAARLNDSDATILEHLGDLYYKLRDYNKARTYYERSVSFAEDQRDRKRVERKLSNLNQLSSQK